MKTFITKSLNTPTGYALAIIEDDGTRKMMDINEITHDGKSLILPENPTNRKFWALSRLKDEDIELSVKEPHTHANTPTIKAPTKGLEEYLSPEDREVYLSLVKKAMRNKEIEMLKSQIDALQSKLTSMENN
jgi:hypothetical protein